MPENPKTPRLKTKRGLVGMVVVIGMLLLIVYLFAAKGPDLGQSEINAQKAKQAKEEQAKLYAEVVPDPKQSSLKQYEQAKQTLASNQDSARQAEKQRLSQLPPMPSMADDLSPPSGTDGSSMRDGDLSDAHDAAMSRAPRTNDAGTEAAAPGFVMYQAGGKGKKDGRNGRRDGLLVAHDGSSVDDDADNPVSAETDPALKQALGRLEQLQAMQKKRIELAGAKANQTPSPGGESNQAWLYQRQNEKVEESKPIVAKRNKGLYWIAPGTIIHAVAVNAIDTSLPGTMTARVTEPLYDSRYGSHLVIPAGSTLKGTYNASVSDGQKRVQIAFDTIVTPAGGIIPIKGLVGSDGLGRSGVAGKLHTHFWKRMGIATLMAAEAVGMDRLSKKEQVVTGLGASGSMPMSSGGQVIVNAANQELKKRFSLGPNITVPAGAVLTISTNTGIEVPPIANAR